MKRLLLYGLCLTGLACTPRDDRDEGQVPPPADTTPPAGETTEPMNNYQGDRNMQGMSEDMGEETAELPPFQMLDTNNDGLLEQNELANLEPEVRSEVDSIPRDSEGRITQEEYERFRMAH
ncbi:MAG: EF-hand domain-containing protein [Oligoflexus sp.]